MKTHQSSIVHSYRSLARAASRSAASGRVRVAFAATVSACALVAASPNYANPVDRNPELDQPAESPTTRIRESLDYLMTTYRVSESEALRRLELQARAPSIADAVKRAVGDELIDVWMDQAGGGKLTFLTSQPDVAHRAIGVELAAQVHVVRSQHTVADLKTAEADLRARLAHLPDVVVRSDLRNGKVMVRDLAGDARRTVQVRQLAELHAAAGVPVEIDTSPLPAPSIKGEERACDILACDPPMRGGVQLLVRRDNGTWGSCTSGFNIRGSNGWTYVLTAGHCVTVPGAKRQYMFHNGLPVLWEQQSSGSPADPNSPADWHYFVAGQGTLDYALLPYQTDGNDWHNYWIERRSFHNLVQAYCVGGSNKPCVSSPYAINGMWSHAEMQVGWIVCATGTGTAAIYKDTNVGYTPGTRCGEIKSKTYKDYYHPASVLEDGFLIMVNICSRQGDSGGPLFSQIDNRAYGILSGGPPASGACKTTEDSFYSPLSKILEDLTRRTGITMSVIDSPDG